MNSEEFHGALYRERCRRETVEASNRRMRSALEKIASPTQTTDLLWWQVEAREALAKVGGWLRPPEKPKGGLAEAVKIARGGDAPIPFKRW